MYNYNGLCTHLIRCLSDNNIHTPPLPPHTHTVAGIGDEKSGAGMIFREFHGK